ncbi:MAG: hypothetical protein ACRDJE_19160 [Dehalococcoidia bacterium]
MTGTPAGRSKPIRLSVHARGYFTRRGFTEAEVEDTIRIAAWRPARANRLEAAHEFPYGTVWNGVIYATKRVRAIFVEEPTEIVVVTVYTYFY